MPPEDIKKEETMPFPEEGKQPMTEDEATIERNFTYHAPKGDQPKRYDTLRTGAKGLARIINNLCPNSREKSLAMTKLEEAIMWANASIARNE